MRAVMPSLLSDFLRGDPERKPEDFKPPESAFAAPGKMKAMPALKWRPGMLFLGVIDGEVKTDADGRRHVVGGQTVGVDDDRHVCTFAGSRSGKGRACILPNMLHYPGSVLATDRPEVTKRSDLTHKRTNHELRPPLERHRARP
jgi:type IV secretion system protein VirD4